MGLHEESSMGHVPSESVSDLIGSSVGSFPIYFCGGGGGQGIGFHDVADESPFTVSVVSGKNHLIRYRSPFTAHS